jgi:succinate-semialdehyde dehydrogenase/glutarate-semialdehyde dehydrogenase
MNTETTFRILSAIDGTLLAELENHTSDDVDTAVTAAKEARDVLAALTAYERADLCRAVAARLIANVEEVSSAVVRETGRPLASGRDEVHKAASGMILAAEEVVRMFGAVVPVRTRDRVTFTSPHPTGVWGVLSPWNFPVNIPLEYLGPALASGNPVVWKPAPSTSASALIVLRCFDEAGVPPGAVNLITTDRLETARRITTHPDIVGIGLTGGTATGKAVAASAVGKELILELGGNGPIIVYADADLDAAAESIAIAGFSASGQICSATGRVLAAREIAGELAERVAAIAPRYTLGEPFDDATVIGPVHDLAIADRIRSHVKSALADGAQLLTSVDSRDWPTDTYIAATVLGNVREGSAIDVEETFGPVVPIVPVDSERLIEVANNSDHALSVAVFTNDYSTALRAAAALNYGTVVVNDRSSYWELHLPFGGWSGRSSGTGRVGVPEVLRRMTQIKTTTLTF